MKKKDKKGRILQVGETQEPSGRYRYSYYDGSGKRKSVYAWRLTETDKAPTGRPKDRLCLREKEKIIDERIREGLRAGTKGVTLTDQVSQYLRTKDLLATSTAGNYVYLVDRFLRGSWLGDMDITEIRKGDISRYYLEIYRAGLKSGSVQILHCVIHAALQMAADDDRIRKNPAVGAMTLRPGHDAATKDALTPEETRQLLEYAKDHPYCRNKTYFYQIALALGTGVRVGELAGLRWEDIDWDKGTIRIDHQLQYRKINGEMVHYITRTKTGCVRTIPLQPVTYSILDEYRKRVEWGEIPNNRQWTVDGYKGFLFTGNKGQVVSPAQLGKALTKICDKAGIRHISPHILRHTYCTRLIEAGVDVKTVQRLMGHASVQVTLQIYTHVSQQHIDETVMGLPDIVFGAQ